MLLSEHCSKLFESDCCAGTCSSFARHHKWDKEAIFPRVTSILHATQLAMDMVHGCFDCIERVET